MRIFNTLTRRIEEPDQAAIGIALVCHPHPQHGGTMHNKVVYRVAKGLRRSGHVVMRFNYRGVNLSVRGAVPTLPDGSVAV